MEEFNTRKEPRYFKFLKWQFMSPFSKQSKPRLYFKINDSSRGMRLLSLNSKFLKQGTEFVCTKNKTYQLRWKKCHFGFLYAFGLECV
jgi:hypothetical protein